METLVHILSSFDIFQVIFTAFPKIFIPVAHSLKGMVIMLTDIAGKQFAAHPGLISGMIIFLLVYLAWSGYSGLKKAIVHLRPAAPRPSY